MRIPTTDEMDGLFSEIDIANKYVYMICCNQCFGWTRADLSDEQTTPFMSTQQIHCEHCYSTNFDTRSTHSIRTFDIQKAKKISKDNAKKKK